MYLFWLFQHSMLPRGVVKVGIEMRLVLGLVLAPQKQAEIEAIRGTMGVTKFVEVLGALLP
jgi:hypothetical protein